jgi:hypothetical protein
LLTGSLMGSKNFAGYFSTFNSYSINYYLTKSKFDGTNNKQY